MGVIRQHLIDPEICIRCHACEEACPKDAISHNDDNVVVDPAICDGTGDCLGPCPTGAIDNWRLVTVPHTLEAQLGWLELPEDAADAEDTGDGLDDAVAALLDAAHQGAGGRACAPASAARPVVNHFPPARPARAVVQGNYRLTADGSDIDIRHLILNFEGAPFPVLEGQSVGITPPGTDANGRPHHPRLYTVSSPRDGERPGAGNISLTVKREPGGLCSNYLCDLERGDTVAVSGPYGESFLMPDDAQARLIMICTGTGAAPFRAFTMRHQRAMPDLNGRLHLFFGARSPRELPYFGPLAKVPDEFLAKHFAFSRLPDAPKVHVQDRLREEAGTLAPMLDDANTYIYLCGLKAMEEGVEAALTDIAAGAGLDWPALRARMLAEGRYHVETY